MKTEKSRVREKEKRERWESHTGRQQREKLGVPSCTLALFLLATFSGSQLTIKKLVFYCVHELHPLLHPLYECGLGPLMDSHRVPFWMVH